MSELLEEILSNDNMNAAYKRVCANKGSGGVDGVTVEELKDYIQRADTAKRIQTSAGQKGRNTKAKWRSEKTRNPNCYGQGYSAGNRTGAVTDV